jgi:hypothetical protein
MDYIAFPFVYAFLDEHRCCSQIRLHQVFGEHQETQNYTHLVGIQLSPVSLSYKYLQCRAVPPMIVLLCKVRWPHLSASYGPCLNTCPAPGDK